MGLKNLTQQLGLIARASTDAMALKQYANSLNNILKAMDNSWTGGKDKYKLLVHIADCVNDASNLANRYNSFSATAKRWLSELDKLDKLSSGILETGLGSVTVHNVTLSTSSKIIISTEQLNGYADQIQSLGTRLDEIQSGRQKVFNSLDSLIQRRLPYNLSSTSFKNEISQLKNRNNNIANKIRAIANLYEKAENAIIFQIGNAEVELGDVAIAGAAVAGIAGSNRSSSERVKENSASEKNKNSFSDKLDNIIAEIKKTETGKKIVDDLTDVGIGGKIKDIEELLENIKNGNYSDVVDKVGSKLIGKLYDKKTGEFSIKALKGKSIIIAIQMAFEEDNVIKRNIYKYEQVGVEEDIKEGRYLKFLGRIPAVAVQGLGKGGVDACCRLFDSMIQATPGGKALDYVNAISKDTIGISPEELINMYTDGVSHGVDIIVDGGLDVLGKLDDLRNDIYGAITGKPTSRQVASVLKSETESGVNIGGVAAWQAYEDMISSSVDSSPIGGTGSAGGGGGGTGGSAWYTSPNTEYGSVSDSTENGGGGSAW